jgi:hypothetical protein
MIFVDKLTPKNSPLMGEEYAIKDLHLLASNHAPSTTYSGYVMACIRGRCLFRMEQ